MPPKHAASKQQPPSKSRELITTGPKEVVVKKSHSKRDADGHKPTTARALVLRNGKYGSMGTGEVILASKMSGREKLDLLAEDLIARYEQALATPFSGEKAIKIAQASFMAYIDDIQNLHDPILFHQAIKQEATARKPQLPPLTGKKRKEQRKDPLTDANFVGSVVSSRIHNAYLFASAWRLVGLTLTDNVERSEGTVQIRDRLKAEPEFRAQYLVLYDLVNILVGYGQQKFAQLATTAPHWSQYFQENKNKEAGHSENEYVFSWEQLKSVHKSFLDSIVVELCLPQSTYPKQILIQLLSEAIDETPRDAKRFPQELWDAMGDLSATVQLLDLLENPLLGPDGDAYKREDRRPPEEYENWVDAQLFSEQASREYANYQNMLVPIDTELLKANVVQTVWKFINLNYKGVCGKTIDELWQLDDIAYRKPSWHAVNPNAKKDEKKGKDDHADYDSDHPPDLVPFGGSKKKANEKPDKKRLAIAGPNYDDDNGSMPSLQTISDTSEDEEFDDDDDFEEDSDSDEESEDEDEFYDEDEEDHLRELLREAMDVAAVDPDFYNPRKNAQDFDGMAKDRKGNPFIKLLGSLRGRMFNANPNLKTDARTQPRTAYSGSKPPASAYTPVQATAPKPSKPKAPAQKSTQPSAKKATVEDVSDEDETAAAAKKKKKKPKKKKKKTASATADGTAVDGDAEDGVDEVAPDSPAPIPPMSPTPAPASPAPSSPAPQKKPPSTPKPKTQPKPPSGSTAPTGSTLPPFASTTSLPETAQSARSYLRTAGLAEERAKLKTRGLEPSMLPIPEKKNNFFSRFTSKKEKKPDPDDKPGDRHSFLSKMTKKTKSYMHQLLHSAEDEKQGIAPLKWEHFVRVMREMGFDYDPSTAGSSVRFDPPDPRDPPITFHKPHPDPTLQPHMVRTFGKRLKQQYGWSEEDFYNKAAGAF